MAYDDQPGPSDRVAGTPFPASTGYLLARAGAEARRLFSRLLAEHGITPHHFGALMTLAHYAPCSHQQVSEVIGVDPRNTTPLIDALLERTLIARSVDPQDRRRWLLDLTDEGRHLVGRLHENSLSLEDQLLDGLEPEHRAHLRSMLLTILDSSLAQNLTSPTAQCPDDAVP